DAAAVALRADDRRRARLRARAAAVGACDRHLDRDFRLGAAERVLEREPHLGLEVVATHRLRAGTSATGGVPEDPAEDVAEIAEVDVAVLDVRAAARAWPA